MQLLILAKMGAVVLNINTVIKMNTSLDCRRKPAGRGVEEPSTSNLVRFDDY